jgi:hypothetical protein
MPRGGTMVTLGLAAAAGYLLYQYGLPDFASPAAPPVNPAVPEPAPAVVATAPTRALVLKSAAVTPDHLYNTDEWNHFYNQVRGIPGPAPEDLFPSQPRERRVTIDEWWAAMQGKGFSGLGCGPRNPFVREPGGCLCS